MKRLTVNKPLRQIRSTKLPSHMMYLHFVPQHTTHWSLSPHKIISVSFAQGWDRQSSEKNKNKTRNGINHRRIPTETLTSCYTWTTTWYPIWNDLGQKRWWCQGIFFGRLVGSGVRAGRSWISTSSGSTTMITRLAGSFAAWLDAPVATARLFFALAVFPSLSRDFRTYSTS